MTTKLSDKVKAQLARSQAEHAAARERGEAFTPAEISAAQQDRVNFEIERRPLRGSDSLSDPRD